jgi:4-hydroxy-tetrahydrodipicolinate reductase
LLGFEERAFEEPAFEEPAFEEPELGEAVRVIVLGTGRMGSAIVELLLEKPGLELAGAFGRRRERAGTDVGLAVGRAEPLELAIESDLVALLERTRPAVAIQATCSRLADAEEEIATCLARGVHVISIAEEMAWPAASAPERAARLDALARAHGVVAIGTGVNPGFVLDTLVVTLTGVCARVDAIRARRVNDLAPYGPTVLRSQGVGLAPEAFRAAVDDGAVVGHVGFRESIAMVAAALGWKVERVEETREPIVSSVRRETPHATVEPGQVAGCLHRAVGFVEGRPAIVFEHPQQIRPEAEGVVTEDAIEIDGRPDVRLAGSPEIPGGVATAALAVNLVPRVLAATPGLRAMTDLPPPAAIPGAPGRG